MSKIENNIIHSLDAAGAHTASKYLHAPCERKIMINCSLFRGLKKLRLPNWGDRFDHVGEIDIMLMRSTTLISTILYKYLKK